MSLTVALVISLLLQLAIGHGNAREEDILGCNLRGGESRCGKDEKVWKLDFWDRLDEFMFRDTIGKANELLNQDSVFRGLLQNDDRPCGTRISIVTTEEIRKIMTGFLDVLFLGHEDGEKKAIDFLDMLKYDLIVSKVCISCADIISQRLDIIDSTHGDGENDGEKHTYGFETYCAKSFYGYNAMHSALVFAPKDPNSDEIINGVSFRGFMYARSTIIDLEKAISLSWPDDVNAALRALRFNPIDKLLKFAHFLSPAAIASAGAVSVVPDFIGYGESSDYNRTFLAPLPYMQAFATSWIAAQQYIAKASNGCTQLDNVVTIAGYSEGGYSSIVGALALSALNLQILSVHTGGGPYNLPAQIGWTLKRSEEDPSYSPQLLVAFLAYSYSNDFSFLPNSMTGQQFLAREWMNSSDVTRNVVRWFTVPDPISSSEMLALLPSNSIDIVDPDGRATVQAALDNNDLLGVCSEEYVSNSTEFFCQAMREASLWGALMSDVDFPTFICHSKEDDIVAYENVPPLSIFELNPNLYLYQPEDENLAPRGGHSSSQVFCNFDPISVFAFSHGYDAPSKMTPMDVSDAKNCPSAGSNQGESTEKASSCSSTLFLGWCVLVSLIMVVL